MGMNNLTSSPATFARTDRSRMGKWPPRIIIPVADPVAFLINFRLEIFVM